MGKFVWRVLGTVAPLLAGFLATKVVNLLWRTAGAAPVDKKSAKDSTTPSAVGYAAVSGLAAAAARSWAVDRAAKYYEESAGHPPAALQPRPTTS